MQAFLSDFLISIVPTFMVSRVLLWFTKGLTHGFERLVVVNAASLGLCVLFGVWVLAGRFLAALALFAPGQLAWLLVDLFRLVLQRRRAGK